MSFSNNNPQKMNFGMPSTSGTNEVNATFQHQYFANIATSVQSRNVNDGWWWLRSPIWNGICDLILLPV